MHEGAHRPATQLESPLRVAFLPAAPNQPDAYQSLLRNALVQSGVSFVDAARLARWARTAHDKLDLVHLHWLELLVERDPRRILGLPISYARVARLLQTLWVLRRGGVAVVWTVHNLSPHEPVYPTLERRLSLGVMRIADQVIVRSERAAETVSRCFGHGHKIVVVPRGAYGDLYPPPRASREELRGRYGLEASAFVYLAFGAIRPYKRLPELVSAFRSLDADDVALLIVGPPTDAAEVSRVQQAAADDPRIRVVARRLPTSEVSSVHHAADAAAFAYDTFSSAATLLALESGLPIVLASDAMGLADGPAVVVAGQGGLAEAMAVVRTGYEQRRQFAALHPAVSVPWSEVGARTFGVYERARENVRDERRRRPRSSIR